MATVFREPILHRRIPVRRYQYLDEERSCGLTLKVPVQLPFFPTGEEPFPIRRFRVWGWRPYEPDWTSSLAIGVPIAQPFLPVGEDPYPIRRYRVWGWRAYEPDWTEAITLGVPTPVAQNPTTALEEDRPRRKRPVFDFDADDTLTFKIASIINLDILFPPRRGQKAKDPEIDPVKNLAIAFPTATVPMAIDTVELRRRRLIPDVDTFVNLPAGIPFTPPFINLDPGDIFRKRKPNLPDLEAERALALLSVTVGTPFQADELLRLVPRKTQVFRQYWSDEITYIPGSIPHIKDKDKHKQFIGEVQQMGTGDLMDSSMG